MLTEPEALLLEHLDLLTGLDSTLPALDLACGAGRNGLVLAEQGIPVVFADRSAESLGIVSQRLADSGLPGRTWQVDLEVDGANPLSGQYYRAVIVFRYLYRPLFEAMKEALMPGGLVIYETFTVEQSQFGHPRNPAFLLQAGELSAAFRDWEIIHDFEGVAQEPERAVAQVVARKPVLA